MNKLFTASAIAGTALLLLIAPSRAQQPDPGEATDHSVGDKAPDIGIEEIVVTGRGRWMGSRTTTTACSTVS